MSFLEKIIFPKFFPNKTHVPVNTFEELAKIENDIKEWLHFLLHKNFELGYKIEFLQRYCD